MKKILSVILVLSMLLASTVLLTSCGKITVKDIEKDAYTTISAAMQNTSDSFFEASPKIERVIEDALKCGAFNITFESDDINVGSAKISKISETIYVDSKKEKFVSDTLVNLNGKDLSALLFVDKEGVQLQSESILGSNKALSLNLESLKNKLKDSSLADSLGLTDADIEQVLEIVEALETALEQDKKENLEKIRDFYNDIYEICKQTVTEEKVEKDQYLVVTYTIDNQVFKAILNKYVEYASEYSPEEITAEAKAELDDMLATLDEELEISLSVKLFINAKENVIDKFTLNATLKNKPTNETIELKAEATFSDSQIKLSADVKVPSSEKMSATLTLNKEKTKEATTFTLSAKVTTGSVEIDILNASYSQAKDGSITLKADVYNGLYDRAKLEIKGKLQVEKKEMKLEFTSLTANEETYNFKASFSAKALSSIPKAPDNAKDVVTLTEDEIIALIEGIEDSELAKIIEELTPSVPDFDYYY